MKKFNIGSLKNFVSIDGSKLVLIGGPCAIESETHALKMAEKINKICTKLKVPFIYKSSFDKDCRSSIKSFHGLGLDTGLKILNKVQKEINIPVTTDFSNAAEAHQIADVCDLLQIPAYLCRQTSILKSAAVTGKPINIKKGQFMSPSNMHNSIKKIEFYGNKKIILTDRGTFFGYSMLVNDFRSMKIMKDFNYPVCFDATHSIQLPTGLGLISGGQREFIPLLVRAATAAGADLLFMEIHDDPSKAKSNSQTVLNIKFLEKILIQAKLMWELNKKITKNYSVVVK